LIPGFEDGRSDQWAWIERDAGSRQNPTTERFGATTFGTNGYDALQLTGVTGHDTGIAPKGYGYLDLRTESLYNTALATRGNRALITPYRPPGLTDFQKSLLSFTQRGENYAH
jgi:hypothetical protein